MKAKVTRDGMTVEFEGTAAEVAEALRGFSSPSAPTWVPVPGTMPLPAPWAPQGPSIAPWPYPWGQTICGGSAGPGNVPVVCGDPEVGHGSITGMAGSNIVAHATLMGGPSAFNTSLPC
jgi:hypothetical protein